MSRAMREEGYIAAADEILVAEIMRCTYDARANAGYVYLLQSEPVRPGETPCPKTVCFAAPHWFNVDLRSSGKVFGIELLAPSQAFALQAAGKA